MTSPFAPSSRSAVAPFEVMDVLATVARMRAEGREVISLCAGEPRQGAPGPVHEAAAAIHAEGRSLGYTPALGTAALRSAIAGHYRRWYGLDVDPTEVAVTTGSSGGFVLAFLAAFDHGDRVALARPGYPAYRNILAGLGCEVVDIETGPAERYQPTVAQLEAAGVRVLFDDRKKVSPGVRFGDFELLGVPSMLVIGRGLADGLLEIKDRATGDSREIRREDVVAEVLAEIGR